MKNGDKSDDIDMVGNMHLSAMIIENEQIMNLLTPQQYDNI